MKKSDKLRILIISAITLFSAACADQMIKDSETGQISMMETVPQKTGKTGGFATLSDYTEKNYGEIKKEVTPSTDTMYVSNSTAPFMKDDTNFDDKHWFKRDWPFSLLILGIAGLAALVL